MNYIKFFVKVFQFTVGILPKEFENYNIYCILGLVTVHFILLLGEIIAFVKINEGLYRVEIIYQSLCFVYICTTQYFSYYKKQFVISICKRLSGDLPALVGENAHQKAEEFFAKLMKILVPLYLSSMGAYISAPLLNFFVSGMNYDDPISYPLPFWYAVWNINSVAEYFVMNTLQNVLSLFVFFVYGCSFFFVICSTISLKAHIEEISNRVTELKNRKTGSVMQLKIMEEEDWEEIEEEISLIEVCPFREETLLLTDMKEIIMYYQMLFRLIQDVAYYMEWIFTAAIGWFVLVALLTLFMTTQITSDLIFKIKIFSVVTNTTVSFFFFCYVAETISHMNENLLQSFYEIPWHYQYMRLRKMLLILQIHAQQPVEIKAFGMYAMNLNLFGSVLKLIYSCLNMLLLMKSKEE